MTGAFSDSLSYLDPDSMRGRCGEQCSPERRASLQLLLGMLIPALGVGQLSCGRLQEMTLGEGWEVPLQMSAFVG